MEEIQSTLTPKEGNWNAYVSLFWLRNQMTRNDYEFCRVKALEEKGIHFIGSGVSGGEEGARYGPSLMPGGDKGGWEQIKPIFQAICAKAGGKPDGDPCCDWVGGGGAGHYVKMVHNGIEYGDMQVLCEAYQLMKGALGMGHEEMSAVS